jgi:rubrerythrin
MAMLKTVEKVDTHPLKGSQPTSKIATKYVCPKDGSASKTDGKCSKCGTRMVKVTETIDTHPQKGSQPKSKTVTKYVCPMDGYTSDTKGECPKCGWN